MRQPAGFSKPGITAVALDVTRPDSIAEVTAALGDVTVLVNNAGIARLNQSALDGDFVDVIKHLMETGYDGIVRLNQAFAPALAANGGGAIIKVLSDATLFSIPLLAAYASSKSAAWSYTNALHQSRKERQTRVLAPHVGFLDTDRHDQRL